MFNFNDHLQELRSTLIGLILLAAATIIGFVWISIGIYHWLNTCLGSIWGPIVLGLIYLLPIVIYAFIKAFIRSPLPATPPQNDYVDIAALNVAKIIENLSGRPPFWVASATILAGFLATRFPALLSVFMQILTVYAEDVKSRAEKASQDQSSQANAGSTEH